MTNLLNSYVANIYQCTLRTGQTYLDATFHKTEAEAFDELVAHLDDDCAGDYQHTLVVVELIGAPAQLQLKDLRQEAATEIVQRRADLRGMAYAGPGEAP